jgi:hypothetical protein
MVYDKNTEGVIVCFKKIKEHKILNINVLCSFSVRYQQFRIWIFLTAENADFADLTLIIT